MGTEDGREDLTVARSALWNEPFRYEFIQAVRLLREWSENRGAVGRDALPGSEVVRFSVHRDLGFPASEIHDLVESARPSGPPVMTVAFIGLIGPSGVLPTYYSELVVEEAGPDDVESALAAFLDMFHHRLISLFYRAWERNHPQLSPDPAQRGSFQGYLLSLLGECLGAIRGPHDRESLGLLRHAGIWAQRRRTAEGLRKLLEERINYLCEDITRMKSSIGVEVVSFVPRFVEIDESQWLRLGGVESETRLGDGAILGQRVRDWQGQFRVRVGPLSAREFRHLESAVAERGQKRGWSAFQEVVDLTRRYVGPELDFDLVLVLRAEEVPACRLERGGAGPRLGRSWLITRTPEKDVECVLRAVGY